MKFAIFSHAEHFVEDGKIFAYAPYVKEMNLWLKYVDEVKIVAPVDKTQPTLVLPYSHNSLEFEKIPAISLTSFFEITRTFLLLPTVFFRIKKAMSWADHIHLRCPGNIGLLGCIVQIFFPKKIKTVKYAGNWDPNAKQPLSYKLQKWILNNQYLSKNITVLVYGDWRQQNKNIKAFFTASFNGEDSKEEVNKSFSAPFRCMFVGSLVSGKRPMFAVQLVERLNKERVKASLDIYGDGILRSEIESYINNKGISDFIRLKGNKPLEEVKEAYKSKHFLILASKSEGWPKVVAEAMFWGVVPIVTPISCVPWMLGYGSRGILIEPEISMASKQIKELLEDSKRLENIAAEAKNWSRLYTIERFEAEIKNFCKKSNIF